MGSSSKDIYKTHPAESSLLFSDNASFWVRCFLGKYLLTHFPIPDKLASRKQFLSYLEEEAMRGFRTICNALLVLAISVGTVVAQGKDVGTLVFPTSTKSPEAQARFLTWCGHSAQLRMEAGHHRIPGGTAAGPGFCYGLLG